MASSRLTEVVALLVFAALAGPAWAESRAKPAPAREVNRTVFEEPLVELSNACPGVVVELRYATSRNITGKPIYPAGARAMVRRSVAQRLNQAQAFLQDRGFCLKIWDAYRPAWVQKVLWEAIKNPAYVVEPSATGSLHGWGAAVDVTLVDFRGREVRMPTDFDAFSEAARYDYKGNDPEIAYNLNTLKKAMAEAGFRHIRDEWWHYSVSDIRGCGPIDFPLVDPADKPAEEKIVEVKRAEPKIVETKETEPKPEEAKPTEIKRQAVEAKPEEVATAKEKLIERKPMTRVAFAPKPAVQNSEPGEAETKPVEIKRKTVAKTPSKKIETKKASPEKKKPRPKRPLFRTSPSELP